MRASPADRERLQGLGGIAVLLLVAGIISSLLGANLVVPMALAESGSAPTPPPASAKAGEKAKKSEFGYEVVTILTKDDRGESLRMPQALFYDHQVDELYLLNGADGRLVVYGPDFFPQDSLGKGRGIGAPVSGCIDSQGNLYIPQASAPGTSPRVTVLNSAFLPVKELTLSRVPDLGNFSPQRIALGKGGKIYLTGLESTRVLVIKPDGGFAKWIEVAVDKGGGYRSSDEGTPPEKRAVIRGLAVDALDNLFLLSEETSKIYVFDSEERFLFHFGTKGGGEGKMSRPRSLAIDEARRCIYVIDYMRHTVLLFDFTGTFRFEFGGMGWSPGWFNYPVDIALGRQGQVMVADFFNQRVQVFEVKLPAMPERTPELWRLNPEGKGQTPSTPSKDSE